MNKKERLNAIISHYCGGKPSVFAKFLGVAPSTISSWLSRDTLDYDLIFAKCEMLSPEWLLTGEGDMFLTDTPPKPVTHPQNISIEERLLNLIQEKDTIIREQAEEIGQLRERIAQLTREKEKNASDVQTTGIANAG